jgi:glutathione S-transferase
MKLYYSPGACGLHPQIVLREAGLSFELVRVDLRAHKTADGHDFYTINPKGYVPVLELDDGSRLTEGAVIDQYVADQNPAAKLIPPAGTMDRYRAQEWLHFIGTEIHKSFSPLFGNGSDDVKAPARERIARRFELINRVLAGQPYLLGETFGVADAYLFNMLRWTDVVHFDLAPWPALKAYYARVGERPAVKSAVAAERA